MAAMIEELKKLSDNQKKLLKELREDTKDVLTSEHDDIYILRFLKAREYNKAEAEAMLRKNIQWRKDIGFDTLLQDFQVPKIFYEKMPSQFLGFDKDGRGVRCIFLGITDFKGISAVTSVQDIVKSSIHMYESDLERMRLNNEKTGKNTDTFIIIQDWHGLSLKQFASKRVVEGVIESVKAFESNYPERVYRMAVIRAPSMFSFVYSLIKPLISDVTKKKILFMDQENWREELNDLIGTDIIPKCLGQVPVNVTNSEDAS